MLTLIFFEASRVHPANDRVHYAGPDGFESSVPPHFAAVVQCGPRCGLAPEPGFALVAGSAPKSVAILVIVV